MKKLEKLGLNPAEDWQKERLSCWMYEWNLMQVSSGGANDGADALDDLHYSCDDLMPEGCVASMDSCVETGQIRLMAAVGDEDMVFVAVASVAPDGVICCVPFSPFSEPATPDELLSGRGSEVVRVYCLWNIRKVPSNIVNKSWVVDRLDASEIERLLKGVDAYKCSGLLPDDMLQDAGAAVVHPEDPRREYRSWERQRIDLALPPNSVVRDSSVNYCIESEPQEFLKAAEPGEDYEV